MEWIDELIADSKKAARAEIAFLVNRHCEASGESYRLAWARLYSAFERRTSLRLPKSNKLDWIEAHGRIPLLYKLAKNFYE